MAAPLSRTFICSCNNTLSLPPPAAGLDQALSGHRIERATQLCRREITRLNAALEGTEDILVACTQEAPLFAELAEARNTIAPIRFVNIREQAGWGREGGSAQAKMAALLAMAARDVTDPVPSVSYASQGRVLVIGNGVATLDWAQRLHEMAESQPESALHISVLLVGATQGLSLQTRKRSFAVLTGELLSLEGWLGAFKARWSQQNPIDLDSCVRCGACIEACPSQAIGASFQVDLSRCDGNRACVKACGPVAAIDFDRLARERQDEFDLVLDLRDVAAARASVFGQFHPPQGYHRPGSGESDVLKAVMTLISQVGEFEKPKFFSYDPAICAHSRNKLSGCNQCIEVCSTKAIRPAGERIEVEPHLCMGCGACGTVCPSGAMRFNHPNTERVAQRLRHGLAAYRQLAAVAAPRPVLLIADESGRTLIDALGASPSSAGLPADVLPLFVRDTASFGPDLMLAAMAYGARQVLLAFGPLAAPQYVQAARTQAALVNAILAPLAGGLPELGKVTVLETGLANLAVTLAGALSPSALLSSGPGTVPDDAAVRGRAPASSGVRFEAAVFALPADKRRAMDLAAEHLRSQALRAASHRTGQSVETLARSENLQTLALPNGSPFGILIVDPDKCTLCLACAGACPVGAVMDGQQAGEDRPQLRFLEKNCVQCGLCEKTCPEQAISLQARWNFERDKEHQKVLNEAKPFHCVKCGKAFGTLLMIETMIAKLSNHSAFAGAAAERLKMCSDCRVEDLYSSGSEATIHDVRRGQ